MITAKQYTQTFEFYQRILRENSEKIFRSEEARKFLIKNLRSGDPEELLKVAVNCIADLTGDETIRNEVNNRE